MLNARLKNKANSLVFCLIAFVATSFSASAQGPYSMSIGLPSDGVEGTLDVYFQITLDGGMTNMTGSDITGTVGLTGSASNGFDYNNVTTFSIANGSNMAIVTVPVINDSQVESSESVVATISAPNVGTIGASSFAIANILDDDQGSLILNIGNPVDGSEGGSNVQFTVSMAGGLVNATGGSITGDLTYGGMAADGSDFNGAGTFTIANGNSTGVVSIPVIDDANIENDETLIAYISSPNFGSVGVASATAMIMDNETATTEVSITATQDGAEGDPSTDVIFTVAFLNDWINQTGSSIEGELSFSGTAVEDEDYYRVATYSIADGSNSATVSIPVINSDAVENIETLIATIETVSVGAISSMNQATANIFDNDLAKGEQVNYIVTPNGDGENDYLELAGLDSFPVHKLMIFNQWGEVIFRTESYNNKWQGNGNILNGTYYYTLQLGGESNVSRGYIELRR